MSYNNITLEECFIIYHASKTACLCDGDDKEIIFSVE